MLTISRSRAPCTASLPTPRAPSVFQSSGCTCRVSAITTGSVAPAQHAGQAQHQIEGQGGPACLGPVRDQLASPRPTAVDSSSSVRPADSRHFAQLAAGPATAALRAGILQAPCASVKPRSGSAGDAECSAGPAADPPGQRQQRRVGGGGGTFCAWPSAVSPDALTIGQVRAGRHREKRDGPPRRAAAAMAGRRSTVTPLATSAYLPIWSKFMYL